MSKPPMGFNANFPVAEIKEFLKNPTEETLEAILYDCCGVSCVLCPFYELACPPRLEVHIFGYREILEWYLPYNIATLVLSFSEALAKYEAREVKK